MSAWRDWIGRSREQSDRLEPQRAQALQATLGLTGVPLVAGDPLPSLWHWLYFWEPEPPAALGSDGHPAKGGFLPPIELPRRMWAGGRLVFHRPLILGEAVTRRSRIKAVVEKEGRSGPLAFVTVEHRIGEALVEEHDIVYRDVPAAQKSHHASRPPAPVAADWQENQKANPTLLFRYSALTFNSHRIHYDLDYARKIEHYPGLVVHGPLMAVLMLGAAERVIGKSAARFSFQVRAPVFHGEPFAVCGARKDENRAALWIEKDKHCCLSGEAGFP